MRVLVRELVLELTRVLHGRGAELVLVADTLASARAGRGRAACFTGEAGIGKSTLLAAARDSADGCVVCAGAAWESGGAPPYWPWLSILRDAHAHFGPRVRDLPGADAIASLAPEWGARAAETAPDPDAARFALLDGVARALVALSREQPLLILLDDLHAADVPTLELFGLFVRELPRASIAVIAAWREGELAVRADAAQRLARAARHATLQPLRRLTAAEVTGWIGSDGAAVHASTEGNPLFVEETIRAQRAGTPPRAIAAALEDHLSLLSHATRDVLAAGSVLGRELDPAVLASVSGAGADALAAALREAESAGVVDRRGFRHVLLRDHLYDALPPSRRAELHQRAGEALPPGPARAHHLLRGTDRERAISAAREAARAAAAVFAFEDEIALLEAALAAGDSIELRIDLAEARHRAGQGDQARADCIRAAELARVSRPDLLARIALVYAAELQTGRRDAQMIALLEEALALQPPGDSAMRARLMARLGAARVPDPNNDAIPIALADEAVEMAKRVGDPDAEMYVLRFAGHAAGFRRGIAHHVPRLLASIALADRLGRPLEALEQRTWLVGAYRALANPAAADAMLAEVEALLSRLPQPHYRWRVPILRANQAVLTGDFLEAKRQLAVARDLASEYHLRTKMTWTMAAISVAVASGDRELANLAVDEARPAARTVGNVTRGMLALALAIAGRHDEARAELCDDAFARGVILCQFGCEAVVWLGERDRAEQAIASLSPAAELFPLALGPSAGLTLRPPMVVLGELHLLLGRRDEAIKCIERGLELARSIDAAPFIANAEAALARARGATAAPTPRAESIAITCSGNVARVVWRGREIVAPAGKGFEYLAALITVPGREIHVSDLVGDEDRGDAGEVLDARARADYRERAKDLEAELDEARARNDLGRADRLGAELEAIADQLLGASGLGGRARRAGSRVERARVNVQRRIKDAIRRLAGEDEALGRYLEATISTGVFCSFTPV